MSLKQLAQPWSSTVEKSNRLNIPANSRFIWMHHPKNWELVSFKDKKDEDSKTVTKHLFLPVFTPLRCVAGVNEVRPNGRRADDSVARAKFQNQGFTILDPEKYGYLVTYPAMRGVYHTDKFEILEAIGNTIVKDYDRDAMNDFRRELMQNKVLKLPHKHFIRLMLIDNRRSIDKYIKDQHIPETAVKLKRHQDIDRNTKSALKADRKSVV